MSKFHYTNLRQERPARITDISRSVLLVILSGLLGIFGSVTFAAATYTNSSGSISRASAATIVRPRIQMPVSASRSNPWPTSSSIPVKPLGYPLYGGNSHLPEIALTFDDGPNPPYTSQVLAILQKYGVKATFFDVGYLVARYPGLVKQEYDQGNIIGNHSWSHPQMMFLSASAIQSQLTSTSDAIQAAIGARPAFFRPPYGAINSTILKEANQFGVTTVIWDDTPEDWLLPGVNFIASRTLRLAHNGAIILLHDGGGNRAQTIAALPTIITTLQSWGYKFVTLQQLVNDLAKPPTQTA